MAVTYLAPVEVKAMLKGPDRDKVLVVDVREDDFYGGHIRGCIHHPVDHFSSDYEIDSFIQAHVSPRADQLETVVVHCYLSQQRGPFCAQRLASRLAALDMRQPQVAVMCYGFKRFMQLFGDDPDLVEDDDSSDPAVSRGDSGDSSEAAEEHSDDRGR